jgi:hypothetical protein
MQLSTYIGHCTMPALSLYHASQIYHTFLPMLLQITLDLEDG